MGFFDKFKKNTVEQTDVNSIEKGNVVTYQFDIDSSNLNKVLNEYIAFDTETTGLRPDVDRIVELGAVWFQEGKPVKKFSTLVNPKIPINPSASAVNGITDAMLAKAPSEEEVYPQFIEFLGNAAKGEVYLVAHNASFDFGFLKETFKRLGYNATFKYVDSLKISRNILKNSVSNHKQATLEQYFGIHNTQGHRAASDAEACGHILWKLLNSMKDSEEKKKEADKKSIPTREEYEVCAVIQKIIADRGGDYKSLRYYRNSGKYVSIFCPYDVVKFKICKKGTYMIVKADRPEIQLFPTEPCTQSEGGGDFIRVYFSNPFELESLSNYIFESFYSAWRSWEDFKRHSPEYAREDNLMEPNYLKEEFLDLLLNSAKMREYTVIDSSSLKKQTLTKLDVTINPIHSRIPVCEIQNLDDWDKGFDEGFPFYELGEDERKKKNIENAIKLFDIAREKGYVAPALFESYAKAYRQIKDYENEIAILDEGLEREPDHRGWFTTRQNKAIELLWKVQNNK